jgi:hypothetical protein
VSILTNLPDGLIADDLFCCLICHRVYLTRRGWLDEEFLPAELLTAMTLAGFVPKHFLTCHRCNAESLDKLYAPERR